MAENYKIEMMESGSKLITSILKEIKKPVEAEAKKHMQSDVRLLNKKIKMLKKDDALMVQYADRTCYDTVQGVLQALHLYIISSNDDFQISAATLWLREHENVYAISKRMQNAAMTRADFSSGKKTRKK